MIRRAFIVMQETTPSVFEFRLSDPSDGNIYFHEECDLYLQPHSGTMNESNKQGERRKSKGVVVNLQELAIFHLSVLSLRGRHKKTIHAPPEVLPSSVDLQVCTSAKPNVISPQSTPAPRNEGRLRRLSFSRKGAPLLLGSNSHEKLKLENKAESRVSNDPYNRTGGGTEVNRQESKHQETSSSHYPEPQPRQRARSSFGGKTSARVSAHGEDTSREGNIPRVQSNTQGVESRNNGIPSLPGSAQGSHSPLPNEEVTRTTVTHGPLQPLGNKPSSQEGLSARSTEKRPRIQLLHYIEPGWGGVDLTVNRSGQRGFAKCIREFPLPASERGDLELTEKILLVGEPSVGKTALALRACNGAFLCHYKSTIGVDFFKQKYAIQGFNFTLHIWDTAGQERFRSLTQSYFRGAAACIVAFNLGSPDTLARARQWLSEVLKENLTNRDFCCFLVGCKADMFHAVTREQAETAAHDMNAEYFEVSSKEGTNVDWLFSRIAVVLFERSMARAAAAIHAGVDPLPPSGQKSSTPLHRTARSSSGTRASGGQAVVVYQGGGKGIGDPGAGKGTMNWKVSKKDLAEASISKPITLQGKLSSSKRAPSKCCG